MQPANLWQRFKFDRLISLLFCLFGTLSMGAQQYFINPLLLTSDNGLAIKSIGDVAKDQRGFLWIGGNGGLLRYDGLHFKAFQSDPKDNTTILPNEIRAIYYDIDTDKLWLGHWGGASGISVLDLNTEKATRYPYDPTQTDTPGDDIYWIYRDKFGQIWAGTRTNGVVRYDEEQDNFKSFTYQLRADEHHLSYAAHNSFRAVDQDQFNDSLIWIGTGAGILRFNVLTHEFRSYTAIENPSNYYGVYDLYCHSDGMIYLGLFGAGLYRFDSQREQFTQCLWDAFGGKEGQSSHVLQKIVGKSDNRLWITTEWGLLEYDIPTQQIVQSWRNNRTENQLYGAYATDDRGRAYVWDSDLLAIYDPLRQQIRPYNAPIEDESKHYIFRRFWEDESTGHLWAVGQGTEGLYCLDRSNNEWRLFRPHLGAENAPEIFNGWDVLRTSAGELLVLEQNLIYQFLEAENKLVPYRLQPPWLGANYRRIIEDRRGNLWIGTYYKGLIKIDPKNETIVRYYDQLIHPDFKAPGALWDLKVDRNGNIWARNRGVLVYDTKRDTFHSFPYLFPETKKVHHVQSLGLDGNGNVWALAHDQLIGVTDADHPERGFVRVLNKETGLKTVKPWYMTTDNRGNAWITKNDLEKIDFSKGNSTIYPAEYLDGRHIFGADRLSDGSIIVGFKRAIGIFHPDSLKTAPIPPQPYIQTFKVFEAERATGVPLYQSPKIRLNPGENFFSFEISAINPSFIPGITYRYQMEGVDPNWVDPGARRYIAYTDLPPGDYTFRLRAFNHLGIESEQPYELKVHIAPPWYRSWPAYPAYVVLASLVGWQVYQFLKRREVLKRNLELQQAEATYLKELDEFKSRFYANITHEFRTPLTIIQGLADQIQRQTNGQQSEKAGLIRRNSIQLQRLINQLLDLSKLEAGALTTHQVQSDIVPYLAYLGQSFQSLAADRQIQFTLKQETASVPMDFDPEKIQRIIENLLANALKFTPPEGIVQLRSRRVSLKDKEYLQITVSDTGVGIEPAQLPFVFDRFYQVDDSTTRAQEGTGLGLALVKEFAHLAGGTIQVQSAPGQGSCFTVELPITHEANYQSPEQWMTGAQTTVETSRSMPENGTVSHVASGKPVILIVEDNADIIYYLRTCLAGRYQVAQAENGQLGWQEAIQQQPDLIISDLMMPEMDGYTLCQRLKQDERTNHIPIILLTAKATHGNRKEGLERGADAYLVKPFDPEELSIRIEQLLQQRAKLKKKYWQAARIRRLEELDVATESQSFMERLDNCIFQHLSDPKFKVDQLAAALYVSRTTLFSELKKATGKSPSQYLNQARLDLADQLLVSTDLTIATIAQQTGFSSDSYFTKKYEAAFGQKPSERRKHNR